MMRCRLCEVPAVIISGSSPVTCKALMMVRRTESSYSELG